MMNTFTASLRGNSSKNTPRSVTQSISALGRRHRKKRYESKHDHDNQHACPLNKRFAHGYRHQALQQIVGSDSTRSSYLLRPLVS